MKRYILYFLFFIPSLLEAQLTRRQVNDFQPGDLIETIWGLEYHIDSFLTRTVSINNDTITYTIDSRRYNGAIPYWGHSINTAVHTNLDIIPNHMTFGTFCPRSDSVGYFSQYCGLLSWRSIDSSDSCSDNNLVSFFVSGGGGPYYSMTYPHGERNELIYIKKGTFSCGTFYPIPLGISDDQHSNISLKIFPNPASEVLKVQSLTSNSNFSIYTILGKQITTGISKNQNIDVSKIKPGIYLIKIAIDGKDRWGKFVKE